MPHHLPANRQPRQEKGLSILCVDDDDALARILKLILERGGHTVDVASDGVAALARITGKARGYDVVVTDHQMPQMTGLDLVMQLRASGYQGKIVVHCSPFGKQLESSYRMLQVETILHKPVAFDDLMRAVEE